MENFNPELAIQQVVTIIKKYYSQTKAIKTVNKKEGNDIVTDIDLFMEANIIKELSALYPTHSFMAEENGSINKKCDGDAYCWIIDPIDGTINFAAGLPEYGIVVALQKNGETILGVTYLPQFNELYTAIKGQGAYCNGKKLRVSTKTDLNDCVVMICLDAKHTAEEIEQSLKFIRRIFPKIRGLRIAGSSSVATCWVASGKIEAMINLRTSKSLGSTAGRLFVSEAGGKVTNLVGNPRKAKDTILCSNDLVHDDILNYLQWSICISLPTNLTATLPNKTPQSTGFLIIVVFLRPA